MVVGIIQVHRHGVAKDEPFSEAGYTIDVALQLCRQVGLCKPSKALRGSAQVNGKRSSC